jgi:hypothetical protein
MSYQYDSEKAGTNLFAEEGCIKLISFISNEICDLQAEENNRKQKKNENTERNKNIEQREKKKEGKAVESGTKTVEFTQRERETESKWSDKTRQDNTTQ